MKHFRCVALSLAFVAWILSAPGMAAADPIKDLVFLTENYAPFNYKKDGKTQGIAIDLLLKMFKQVGSSKTLEDIKVGNWAHGYKLAQNTKNTVLFSTTRTKARENLFKWVGPIVPTTISVIAKKSMNAKILKFEDLNKYKIAVVREDIGELLLNKKGINSKSIFQTNSSKSSAKMLAADRLDMWAYDQSVAFWNLQEVGENPDDYEVVYELEESQLYFAIQKHTDDAVIAILQAALDAVREAEK